MHPILNSRCRRRIHAWAKNTPSRRASQYLMQIIKLSYSPSPCFKN